MNRVILFFLLLSSVGCTETLDTTQADELEVTPLVTTSLIYFETDENVLNDLPPGLFFEQDFTFEAFQEAFINDNILSAELIYELENTTTKPISLRLQFLDEIGNVLEEENFQVPPGEITEPAPVLYGPGGRPLEILQNTTGFQVSATNEGNNTSTSTRPDPQFIFRSAGNFRIQLL